MRADSGRPSPNGAGGLRALARIGQFIMCSASIQSIGLRMFKTSFATHVFENNAHPHITQADSHPFWLQASLYACAHIRLQIISCVD